MCGRWVVASLRPRWTSGVLALRDQFSHSPEEMQRQLGPGRCWSDNRSQANPGQSWANCSGFFLVSLCCSLENELLPIDNLLGPECSVKQPEQEPVRNAIVVEASDP